MMCFHLGNFGLPGPFRPRVRSRHLTDRQTDKQTNVCVFMSVFCIFIDELHALTRCGLHWWWRTGSAVAQHPSAANPQILRHPIDLGVTVNSVPMTNACRERYRLALTADLKDLSRLINLLICNGSMCPYLAGGPGTGVQVSDSAILGQHVVFAAIDTASLSDPVSFDAVTATVYHKPFLLDICYFYRCSRRCWLPAWSALHGL